MSYFFKIDSRFEYQKKWKAFEEFLFNRNTFSQNEIVFLIPKCSF